LPNSFSTCKSLLQVKKIKIDADSLFYFNEIVQTETSAFFFFPEDRPKADVVFSTMHPIPQLWTFATSTIADAGQFAFENPTTWH
jgi:hypothetical protein